MSQKVTFELRRYQTKAGKVPLSEWLEAFDNVTFAHIMAYVDRMKMGNFGKSRSVGEGVTELKMNFGPGYRVYYLCEDTHVVLLCGGDKGSQLGDIQKARQYAADYGRRK